MRRHTCRVVESLSELVNNDPYRYRVGGVTFDTMKWTNSTGKDIPRSGGPTGMWMFVPEDKYGKPDEYAHAFRSQSMKFKDAAAAAAKFFAAKGVTYAVVMP